MSKEDRAVWILDNMRQSKIASANWRKQARECYAFFASDQWSEEDRAILEEQGRPPVVFNRVARTINAIAGLEVQNRQEVRYVPRENTDGAVNEILTAAAKWVRDNCDAEDEESEAFQDTLICGMGWTDTSLDYEVDQEGKIIIERDDALSYYWDSNSKKRNLDDTRWRAKVHKYTEDQVKEQWPDWDGAVSGNEEFAEDVSVSHDKTMPFYDKGSSNQTGKDKLIEVICYQWYEREDVYRTQDPMSGKVVKLSKAKYEAMKDMLEGQKVVKQPSRKYRKAYVIGKQIVAEEDLESQVGFTFNCITGLRDRNNNSWFGLVNLMIDPQRWANKWLSQIMHILNSNSKGGLIAETDAFADVRKAEKDWTNPQAITWVRPGKMGAIQQKQVTQMPTGIAELMKHALESINDVPGVNSEMLGLADRQQAGVLEASRKQAGVTMLAVFFDSLRRYRKEQGRILAKMIIDYIADGRLIRIVGEEGAQIVPLLKDPLMFDYDVVVDDAPTSPNQKERTFQIIMQGLPQMLAAGLPPPPMDIISYMPLPESLLTKWKQNANPELTQQLQQMQQQLEQQGMQMQEMGGQLQAAAHENQQLQEQLMNGDAEKNQADMAVKGAEIGIKREELELKREETQIKYMEAETRRLDAQTKYAQAQSKIEADVAKQALEVAKFQLEQDRSLIEARMQMMTEGGTNDADEAMMADMHRQLTSINDSLSRIQVGMMTQKPSAVGITIMNQESPEME